MEKYETPRNGDQQRIWRHFAERQMQKSLPFQGGFYFHGADTQSRTGDLILTKDALYQLSHISTLTGKDRTACAI